MGQLSGSLIEMNAHMVVSATASALIWIGFLAAVGFLLLGIIAAIGGKGNLYVVFVIIAIAAAAVGIGGARMERVKEIRYCANGPVQIEQIAAKYDIVDIDGKMITVRER